VTQKRTWWSAASACARRRCRSSLRRIPCVWRPRT